MKFLMCVLKLVDFAVMEYSFPFDIRQNTSSLYTYLLFILVFEPHSNPLELVLQALNFTSGPQALIAPWMKL